MRSQKPTEGELLPPNAVAKLRPDLNAMLKAAVEQKVAEILAQQDFAIFEPYYQPRRITDALKRLQTVSEQNKWTDYYSDYGCMICKTKKRPHGALGKCNRCLQRVRYRLNSSMRRHALKTSISSPVAVLGEPLPRVDGEQIPQLPEYDASMGFIDRVEQARRALRKPRKALPQHQKPKLPGEVERRNK